MFFLKFIKTVELQKQNQARSKKLKKFTGKKKLKTKFNFSKLWFIKFNGYILVTIFCFFFKWRRVFKSRRRGKKKKVFLNKPLRLHFSVLLAKDKKFKLSVKKFFFF